MFKLMIKLMITCMTKLRDNSSTPAAANVATKQKNDNTEASSKPNKNDVTSLAVSVVCYVLIVLAHLLLSVGFHHGYQLLLACDGLKLGGTRLLKLFIAFGDIFYQGFVRRRYSTMIVTLLFACWAICPDPTDKMAFAQMDEKTALKATICGGRKKRRS